MELYVAWRAACVAVSQAYDAWSRAVQDDKPAAHNAYIAAIDDEEEVARSYEIALEVVTAN